MKKISKLYIVFSLFLMTALAMAVPALASTAGGFSVSPILPENQVQGTRGFFDLLVSPDQRQELEITINNSNNEEIVVSVEAITATTNRNGIINYTTPALSDESLRYPFSELAVISEELVTIPANSSKIVPVFVTVPDEQFDGIILGSIRVLKDLTEEEKATGGTIVNRYSYVVAVRLQQNYNEIAAEFLLGNVEATLVNHRASVEANIRNPQPKLVKGVEAAAQIYPKGSDETIFESFKEEVDFAPNSIFPFSLIDEAGYGLRPGEYLAKIQLAYEGRTWEFEQEFEINESQAAAINRNSVNQRQAPAEGLPLPIWAIGAIISSVLFLAAMVMLAIVKKKSSKKQKSSEALPESLMRQAEAPQRSQSIPAQEQPAQGMNQVDMLKMLASQMDESELIQMLDQMQKKREVGLT